jgi:hypothetical protein
LNSPITRHTIDHRPLSLSTPQSLPASRPYVSVDASLIPWEL